MLRPPASLAVLALLLLPAGPVTVKVKPDGGAAATVRRTVKVR